MNAAKTALWGLAAVALLYAAGAFSADKKKAEKIFMASVVWTAAGDSYEVIETKTVEGKMKIAKPTASYGARQHWVARLLDSKGNVLFEQSLKEQPYITVPPPNPDDLTKNDDAPQSVRLEKVTILLRVPLLAGASSLVLYSRIESADKPTSAKNFANDYTEALKILIEKAK